MSTCAELDRALVARKKELAILEKTGKGHSLQHQDVLDELGRLEVEYRQQGCEAPPPPRLGRITTTVVGLPLSILTGEQGDLSIEIQATNDGNVDTSVEYSIDPAVAGLTQISSWTVPIPRGNSTQHATLLIAVSDVATPGTHTITVRENVIFGPLKDGAHQQYDYIAPDPSITVVLAPPDPAYAAIEAKARELGLGFTGESVEPTQRLLWVNPRDGKAYRRRYARCTIYYSAEHGAHEIHGDIRDKYDLLPKPMPLSVPIVLGIPVTDEQGCPDGKGRYNQFSNEGAIYWHPDTGPFAVYGDIRAAWAQAGWEAGLFGYPIRDQYIPGPNETSYTIFCLFQNAALWLDNGVAVRSALNVTSDESFREQLWERFNDQLPGQVVRMSVGVTVVGHPGLQPETSTDSVTGYGYGFWKARNRIMTVTLHGFVSLNWGLPDPTFDAHLSLLVYEDNESHSGPGVPPNNIVGQGDHSVYVALTGLSVSASGLYSETVASKVSDAINNVLGTPLQIQRLDQRVQPPNLFGLIVKQDGSVELHHRSLL
jgi:LGFP repeat-containing protein